MISFFSAILAAFLPRRYRSQWLELHGLLPAGAITGGLMELSLSLAFLSLGYFNYFPGRAGDLTHMLSTHGASGSFQAYGTRMFAMLEYLLRPTSLVLIYFALEGTIRLYAAVCTNEVLPTLPIFLIEWMHGRIERRRKEASLGPRLIDDVQTTAQTNSELRVASSRPKELWNELTTISYQGRFYEVVRAEQGSMPRRFVYYLRLRPEWKLIRGIHHYDPEETVTDR
jgi:hypothetical protein